MKLFEISVATANKCSEKGRREMLNPIRGAIQSESTHSASPFFFLSPSPLLRLEQLLTTFYP
jgi:hypothetical protein